MASSSQQSRLLLQRQLAELNKNPVDGFSAGLAGDGDNIYEWDIFIVGPPDTLYDGGFFQATLSFTADYPQSPPKMKFTTPMLHPNVYPDGTVCISILHPPGEDEWGYENASERWLPIHTVETILLSVVSMFSDPNFDSPANIDAATMWRDDPEAFRKEVGRLVRRSQEG